MEINLNIENSHKYQIPAESDIKKTIANVLKKKNIEGEFEVDVKFVDASEIHALNCEYREIDKPTDVLSFPIQEKATLSKLIPGRKKSSQDLNAPILLGDIVLCPDEALEPILKLIEHSTLHLLGFHHKED